jgi:hypothetical protein
MKRYTGQQALYEAISRSRAKAKQGGILEKLLPEHSKPENPAGKQSQQAAEPAVEPVAQAMTETQPVETPAQPTVEHEPQAEPVVDTPTGPLAEVSPELVEPAEPVVKSRPVERVAHPVPANPMWTWLKPRPVQFNEGRIEISVPYYIGVIAGLVLLVVVLGAFRLGQARSGSGASEAAAGVQPMVDRAGAATNPPAESTPRTGITADTGRPLSGPVVSGTARQDVAAAAVQGDHWIVLAQYRRQEDFVPVVRHFAENGIRLGVASLADLRQYFAANGLNAGVLPSGDGFLLVTADAFGNPKIAGTDGHKMKQKIAEVGAKYKGKAPAGLERFAPNYFSDAYGMKIVR